MTTDTFGCVGSTIKLRSGRYIDLANPSPDDIDIADIAGALSKICRFGGQCPVFYSVAEHCCRAAFLAEKRGHPPGVVAAVLMHDAAEAYLGDIVKPLKNLLPEYRVLESRMEAAIRTRFGLERHDEIVRDIDRTMLISEKHALFGDDGVRWEGQDGIEIVEIGTWRWGHVFGNEMFNSSASRLIPGVAK